VKFLGLGKEATSSYAVSVAIAKYIDIVRESVNPDQGFIDPETAAYREGRLRIPGPYIVSGDIDMLVDADSIMEVLSAVTGDEPSTPAGNLRSYKFKPTSSIYSMTMEIAPDIPTGAVKARKLTGTVFKAVRFEAPAREVLTATVTCHAAKDALRAPSTGSPTFSSKNPFVFHHGALQINGSAVADVQAFRMTFENDIPDDIHTLGSRFLQKIHVGGVNITGDMDIVFDNWDYYAMFWGAAAASVAGCTVTSVQVDLAFTECDPAQSVAAGSYPMFRIYLPKVYFDNTRANIDRRERIVQGVDFTAIYASSLAAGVEFEVQTDRSEAWGT